MSEYAKVTIVAALEREVRPLIKDWPARRVDYQGRGFKFFEKDGVALVCGGIGSEAARRATEAIISLYHPETVISAGFAGGLDSSLQPGDCLTPRHVINAGDGSRTLIETGAGTLITFQAVADVEQKSKLAEAYGAQAVDMEAASVARCAAAHGIRFLACKVISDTSDSRLPPITRFIGDDGRFHALKFSAHMAIRPWLWGRVRRLARESAIAAAKLCEVLQADHIRAADVTAVGSGN